MPENTPRPSAKSSSKPSAKPGTKPLVTIKPNRPGVARPPLPTQHDRIWKIMKM
ncbi:uncharacterized protein [Drosophila bipectinata]|uniref:uncharacterized protein n=1 Tax=Drosophila bipectinata TaxID=42026 RepID=UPI0007E67BA8|nr:uncharacterized protein LOC108129452 [Drosophila bipectinata]